MALIRYGMQNIPMSIHTYIHSIGRPMQCTHVKLVTLQMPPLRGGAEQLSTSSMEGLHGAPLCRVPLQQPQHCFLERTKPPAHLRVQVALPRQRIITHQHGHNLHSLHTLSSLFVKIPPLHTNVKSSHTHMPQASGRRTTRLNIKKV